MTQVKQQYEDQPETPEPTEQAGDDPDGQSGAAAEAAAEDAAPGGHEAELEAELAETKDRLLRTLAEMENLRRRTERDVDEARKYAITGFARELLDVADNLSRALDSIPPRARENIELIRNLADGVEMTEKTLLGCFERHQIVKMTPELGEKFDHNRHQAMFEVPTDEHPPGTIAQVLQPGYMIADRLLRPVMVGVAKAPEGKPDTDDGSAEPAGAEGDAGTEAKPGERIDTSA